MYYPPHIKSLLPSLSTSGTEAKLSMGDLRKLIGLALQGVKVDAAWYLNEYPDVNVAINEGVVESAQAHFESAGYFEGRFPCRPQVDTKFYLELYDDVAKAHADGYLEDPESHFLEAGYKEARVGTNFPVDEAWYMSTYNVKLDEDKASAKQHFDQVGYVRGYRPFPLDV